MPEVCEVRLTAQYLSSLIGDSITKIKVLSGRYLNKDIKGLGELKFPLKIKDIQTKGKFMWMTLKHEDTICYLMNTFGLTGKWMIDEEIEFSHVEITVKSSTKTHLLYFADMRNFGTIEFTKDKKMLEKKLNKLAPDLLQQDFTEQEMYERFQSLKNKKKNLVSVMMSQEAKGGIGSGLGNYLVPEILYRAQLSPHRTISSLTKQEIYTLSKTIKHVLKLCYLTNETKYISHLNKFLTKHQRHVDDEKFPDYHIGTKIGKEKFQFLVYGRKFDNDENPVSAEKIIGGRTTYWVKKIQK